MASGRVGGTRSKVSGQVGSEVYKIVKNPDGSYSQVITSKGETTVNTTTPRLQAQRLCTSMVESLMRDLQEVAKISMQSGANKSKSLNAFSSYNLRLVAQDCQAHWYGNNQFVYPRCNRYDLNTRDLGGLYMISSGTLQWDAFTEKFMDINPRSKYVYWDRAYDTFYGVKLPISNWQCTVGQFLRERRLTRLDSIVFVGFRYWYEQDDPEAEIEEFYKHTWLIAQVNPDISDATLLTEDVLSNLFVFKSNYEPVAVVARNHSYMALGIPCALAAADEQLYYWAAFTISYLEGKKKISSSNYSALIGETDPWYSYGYPAYVFGSWMGEPSVIPYPSPFT